METGFSLVSLDEVYPGWDGLDAGARHVFTRVITPWCHGEEVWVPQWDWVRRCWSTPRLLPPGEGLMVEGCGAITPRAASWATEVWWVDADASVRHQRALQRDGDDFAPFWERWALQEKRFFSLMRSQEHATHRLVT